MVGRYSGKSKRNNNMLIFVSLMANNEIGFVIVAKAF